MGEDGHPTLGGVDDGRELLGLVLEFAGLECTQRRVRDDRRGVDHDVDAQFGEFVRGDRVGGPDDDELVAAATADGLDGGLVRLHVRRQDEQDVAVLDQLEDVFVGDVGGSSVEVLVPERLDSPLVLVEDEDVFPLLDELFGDGVAHTSAPENSVA